MKNKRRNFFGVSYCQLPARFKRFLIVYLALFAAIGLKAQNQNPQPSTDVASPNTAPPDAQPQQPAAPPSEILSAPPLLVAPKTTKNEVSVSGDFMLGQGTVTLPLGYSLNKSLGGNVVKPDAFSVPRDSTYYGGTVSYSYGQAWYVDLSYEQGESSGSQSIDTKSLGTLPSSFKIDDTWYQIYVRYTFPSLRGKRFSAYLRAGVSFVQSDLTDDANSPALGRYTQTDSTEDTLGNLGFGLGYSLYTSRRVKLGLQFEGEGFYGTRSQNSLESLSADEGVVFVPANIDNTLYGGIGRVTMRFEYRLGQSGLFKIFGDVGAQGRYTMINYPGASTENELLWGPYVKLGIRYSF
jgi:hypothetical protein